MSKLYYKLSEAMFNLGLIDQDLERKIDTAALCKFSTLVNKQGE